MVNNQNGILNPAEGPMAAYLQDPVVNLRRRMTAILADVSEHINQNRNQSDVAGRLADWFVEFRNAILSHNDIAAVVQEHIPRLQELLNNPNFRNNQVVQFIMTTFIPRMRTLFGPDILPNAPVPTPVRQPIDRDERVRQIRARVLGNQEQRIQMNNQIEQQLELQLDAELQQGFEAILQNMQGIFQANMGRLHQIAQDDQARIQRANQAIDELETIINRVEGTLPHLEQRVIAAHQALDNLEREVLQARREVAELHDAVDRKNERESNSLLTTVLSVAVCIAIRLALPQSNVLPIPGGMMGGPPVFTW